MSPVSPVFHTAATVRIGFNWKQEWLKGDFQTKVVSLISTITESRTRHARGPAPSSRLLHISNYNLAYKSCTIYINLQISKLLPEVFCA